MLKGVFPKTFEFVTEEILDKPVLTAIIERGGSDEATLYSFSYDNGKLKTITNYYGGTTAYSYDDGGVNSITLNNLLDTGTYNLIYEDSAMSPEGESGYAKVKVDYPTGYGREEYLFLTEDSLFGSLESILIILQPMRRYIRRNTHGIL